MNVVVNLFQAVAPVLNSWALRCPPCPPCSCACPAASVALTCGGSASTGSISTDLAGSRWGDRVAGLVIGILVAFFILSIDWARLNARLGGRVDRPALPPPSRDSAPSGRRGVTNRQ